MAIYKVLYYNEKSKTFFGLKLLKWNLEANCLPIYTIRMEITAHDSDSEDIGIAEENISDYVDYMENNFKSSHDYLASMRDWNKYMCD